MYVFSCSIAQQDVDPLFKNLYNSTDWWNNETSLTLITPQGWQSNVISRSVVLSVSRITQDCGNGRQPTW